MEGSEVGTMGANAEGSRANGFPHSPQRLGACGEDADADARGRTVRARLIPGNAEVLADASDASDPRLVETGVTGTPAWILAFWRTSHALPTRLEDSARARGIVQPGSRA
jgi:hypothetical protein